MTMTPAARSDQHRLKAFMTAAAERGESGTVSDLLDGFFERVDASMGFGEAAAMAGMDPQQYAPTTGMRERGMRVAMAEELIARVAEQNAEGMHTEQGGWLRGLVAGVFERLGKMLERLHFTRLAESARAFGEQLRGHATPAEGVQNDLGAIMSGVHAATGMGLTDPIVGRRVSPATSNATPLSVEGAEAMVERVTAGWPGHLAERIEVYSNPSDIPAHRRPGAAVDGDFRGVAGYYLPSTDTVALIASEMRGAVDAERTLWHETMHRALREPLDPDHPIAAHARVYRSLMQASGNRPGDYFGAETLERIHAAQAEAVERCGDPRFAPPFAGAAMVEAIVAGDPEALPAIQRPSVAVALDTVRESLDANGFGALAGAVHQTYERFANAACLDHETQLRRFMHDAQCGSEHYNRAEALAETRHGIPAWMIRGEHASDPLGDERMDPAPVQAPTASARFGG